MYQPIVSPACVQLLSRFRFDFLLNVSTQQMWLQSPTRKCVVVMCSSDGANAWHSKKPDPNRLGKYNKYTVIIASSQTYGDPFKLNYNNWWADWVVACTHDVQPSDSGQMYTLRPGCKIIICRPWRLLASYKMLTHGTVFIVGSWFASIFWFPVVPL